MIFFLTGPLLLVMIFQKGSRLAASTHPQKEPMPDPFASVAMTEMLKGRSRGLNPKSAADYQNGLTGRESVGSEDDKKVPISCSWIRNSFPSSYQIDAQGNDSDIK